MYLDFNGAIVKGEKFENWYQPFINYIMLIFNFGTKEMEKMKCPPQAGWVGEGGEGGGSIKHPMLSLSSSNYIIKD